MNLTCWQESLPSNIPLSMINLPGTHDSATQFVTLSPFSRCQNTSITQQLEMGIRFIDIRLWLENAHFYAVHGIANCRTEKKRNSPLLTFDDIFKDLKSFAKENPTEAIVVLLNSGRGDNTDDFLGTFYEQFIEHNLSNWFLENRIPTLGECRGKFVLIRRCGLGKAASKFTDLNSGINLTKMAEQGSTTSSALLPCPLELLSGKPSVQNAIIQDMYMLHPKAKWKQAAKTSLETAKPDKETLYIHYLSTAGFPFVPRFNSNLVNSSFKNYPLTSKNIYGWIVLDFQTTALNKKIIETNF